MNIKICPKCKEKGEINIYLGGKIPPVYECKRCRLRLSTFPEVNIKALKSKVKNKMKKNKE